MIPLPTISVNFGFNHTISDVALSKSGPSPFRQFGYQLTITQRVAKFINVSLELYAGTLIGEEQRNLTNLNYKTSLFSQRLNVEYNFFPLLKPRPDGRQLVRPYVGFGVGLLSFRSKGDLKDSHGVVYQYWSDGSVNAEAEGTVDASEATPLSRDFNYESDLRDANLDGLKKYSQLAFSLPLNAGARFQITKNIGVNAAFCYTLNFSDMLDNVSDKGVGDRQGKSGNDNHLFASVGLSVFLGQTKPSSKTKMPAFVEDVTADSPNDKPVEKAPAESDYVATKKNAALENEVVPEKNISSTEQESVEVETTTGNTSGNELNKETETVEATPGDNSTVETEEIINTEIAEVNSTETSSTSKEETTLPVQEKQTSEVITTKEPGVVNHSMEDIKNAAPKESGDFHWADLNQNGMIAPDEVLYFIDLLFEGEAVRSVEDIQTLIDYYFEQE